MQNDRLKIEKSLISKLRFMGFILLAFTFLTFAYSLIPQPPEEKMMAQEDFAPEIAELPPLNVYIVMSSFAIVSMACLLIAWKKNKKINP